MFGNVLGIARWFLWPDIRIGSLESYNRKESRRAHSIISEPRRYRWIPPIMFHRYDDDLGNFDDVILPAAP